MNLLRRAGGDTSGTCQYEMGLLELLQCTAALDGLCLSFQGIGDCLLFAILCPRCLSRLREARCRILGARQLESESRVRAHVFLCMLAYYVEWHLREALKPLLHDDEELAVLRNQRVNPVMPTPRSEGASAKAASRCEPRSSSFVRKPQSSSAINDASSENVIPFSKISAVLRQSAASSRRRRVAICDGSATRPQMFNSMTRQCIAHAESQRDC
jgi:hypothetical protein